MKLHYGLSLLSLSIATQVMAVPPDNGLPKPYLDPDAPPRLSVDRTPKIPPKGSLSPVRPFSEVELMAVCLRYFSLEGEAR